VDTSRWLGCECYDTSRILLRYFSSEITS